MNSHSQRLLTRRQFLRTSGNFVAGSVFFSTTPLSLLPRQTRSHILVHRAFVTMGTVVSATLYVERESHAQHVLTRIYEEFQRIDNIFSLYKPGSFLNAVNRAAGRGAVAVTPDFFTLIDAARSFHAQCRGAFDITIEPLMELWGFRDDSTRGFPPPSDRDIRERLDAVGLHQILLNRKTSTVGLLHPRARLNFDGIAVGYAVDRAVALLKAEGVQSAFINQSGDAYALGKPEDADGWVIGIPHPLNPQEIIHQLTIADRAVSTSGNYEKYVLRSGSAYGHILSPFTGTPAASMLSATVFADSSLEADALSTGLFCLSLDEIRSALRGNTSTTLLSITEDGGQVALHSFP